MIRSAFLLLLLIAGSAMAQPTDYYNSQKYENDRRAAAQRNQDAQNDRNRQANTPLKTYSGGKAQQQ